MSLNSDRAMGHRIEFRVGKGVGPKGPLPQILKRVSRVTACHFPPSLFDLQAAILSLWLESPPDTTMKTRLQDDYTPANVFLCLNQDQSSLDDHIPPPRIRDIAFIHGPALDSTAVADLLCVFRNRGYSLVEAGTQV